MARSSQDFYPHHVMLVRVNCDHCQSLMEVSEVKIGKTIVCSRCDREFVAQVSDELEEILDLEEDQPDVQQVLTQVSTANAGGGPVKKHHLTLPPPPPEEWNATDPEEDEEKLAGQRFSLFRPRRKDLAPFLERDSAGDDYSWLLMAGLAGFGFVIAVIILGFILLLVLR